MFLNSSFSCAFLNCLVLFPRLLQAFYGKKKIMVLCTVSEPFNFDLLLKMLTIVQQFFFFFAVKERRNLKLHLLSENSTFFTVTFSNKGQMWMT